MKGWKLREKRIRPSFASGPWLLSADTGWLKSWTEYAMVLNGFMLRCVRKLPNATSDGVEGHSAGRWQLVCVPEDPWRPEMIILKPQSWRALHPSDWAGRGEGVSCWCAPNALDSSDWPPHQPIEECSMGKHAVISSRIPRSCGQPGQCANGPLVGPLCLFAIRLGCGVVLIQEHQSKYPERV